MVWGHDPNVGSHSNGITGIEAARDRYPFGLDAESSCDPVVEVVVDKVVKPSIHAYLVVPIYLADLLIEDHQAILQ